MGDYTKLIVHAEVNVSRDEMKLKVAELGLYDSAYHCGGVIESIEPTRNPKISAITLVGQTKYGRKQEEFLDWLRSHVVQGSGARGVWSMQFTEYDSIPKLRAMQENDE